MKKVKKALSFLLAVLLTLNVLSIVAFAEVPSTDYAFEMSACTYDSSKHKATTTEVSKAAPGDYIAIKIAIANKNASEQTAFDGFKACLTYDQGALELAVDDAYDDEAEEYISAFGEGSIVDSQKGTIVPNTSTAGQIIIAWSKAIAVKVDASGSKTFAQILFKVKNDAESGSCQIAFDSTKENNANGAPVTKFRNVNFTIAGATPTLGTVALDNTTLTYDGSNAQTVKVSAVSAKGTDISSMVNISVEGQNWTVADDGTITVPAGTDAGSYNVSIEPVSGKTLGEKKTVTLTISSKTISDVAIAAIADQTYTGSELKPALTVTGDNGKTLVADKDYTVSYTNNTNVGTATASVAAKGNYSFTTATKNFAIVKANGSVTAPTAKTGLIYNGSAQDLISAGSSTTGTIQYKLGTDGTYGTTIPQAIDAGSYDVYYKVVGDANHTDVAEAKIEATIAKKSITDAEVTLGTALTYTGSAQTQTVSSVVVDGLTAIYTVSNNTATDAGDYELTVTGNGNFTGKATKNFTVAPKEVTATVTVPTGPYTYDGEAKEPVPTVKDGTTTIDASEYTVSYSNNVNVGTATVTITDETNGNYKVSGSTTFAIDKATVSAQVSAEPNVYFGNTDLQTIASFSNLPSDIQNAAYSVVSGSVTDTDSILSGTPSGATFKLAALTESAVGKTASWKIKITSDNYNDIEAEVSVTAVNITFTVDSDAVSENTDKTYGKTWDELVSVDGSKVTAVVDGQTVTGTCELSVTGTPNAGTQSYNVLFTSDDNKYVDVQIFPTAKTIEIAPRAAELTWSTPTTFEYDGTAKSVTASVSNKVGSDTFTIAYSNNSKTAKGDYTAEVTNLGNVNYTLTGSTGVQQSWNITAKTLNENAFSFDFAGLTYTGRAIEPTVTPVDSSLVKDTDYTVTYSNNTNAGVNTAKVTVEGKGNYAGKVEKTFTIAPKTLTDSDVADIIGVTPFNGSEIRAEITVKDQEKVLTRDTDYELSYKDNVNVGTATVTVTGKGNYTGSVNKNYTIIQAAAPTLADIPVSQKYTVTTEQSKAITGIMPANAGTLSYTKGGSEVVTGSATVSWSVADGTVKFTITGAAAGDKVTLPIAISSTNYYDADVNVVVTITDKDVPNDVKVNDITVTYSGTAVPDSAITGTVKFNGTVLEGTWAFDGTPAVTNVADSGSKQVIFTPTDSVNYASVSASVNVTINKATPSGTPEYTAIKNGGKTLADADLKVGTLMPAGGTIKWVDQDNNELPANTKVAADRRYTWVYTPADTANYNEATGSVVLYVGVTDTTKEISVKDNGKEGTVSLKPGRADAGQTVEINVQPKAGYELEDVKVFDKDGNEIPVVSLGNGTYSFTMPKSAVQVVPTYKAADNTDANCPMLKFVDLDKNNWYHDGIHFCLDNGLMNGVSANKFNPNGTTTRGMMMTILARLEGVNTDGGSVWYEKGMQWAKANGISDGTNPEGLITREQMAAMLYRYAKTKGEGFVGSWAFLLDFNDRDQISDWADEAVHWCVMNGIISGKPGKMIDPKGNLTRAEAAAMLQRYCGLVSKA